MNKKTPPAPAETSGGHNPEKQPRKPARTPRTGRTPTTDPESLVIQRSVGLEKKHWKKLGKDASRKIRAMVEAMPENETTL